MAYGTCKFYNSAKGFGFLKPEGGGDDVFIHVSALQRANMTELREGQRIFYEMETSRKTGKLAAANVRAA